MNMTPNMNMNHLSPESKDTSSQSAYPTMSVTTSSASSGPVMSAVIAANSPPSPPPPNQLPLPPSAPPTISAPSTLSTLDLTECPPPPPPTAAHHQNPDSSTFFPFGDDFDLDLQGRLKKVSKLPNGLYETKFKIDRYKFDRAIKNELAEMNSLQELLQDIMTCSGTQILIQMKTKSNSRLRNPLVTVVGSLEGIELAKERILGVFENMRQRVVLKMDVSYKDHSHIIGRGGLSIQQVMDETGSHIHFPDSNRISDVKKSNVVLVCGSPHGVEQARCRIRRLLPLIVHFQIPLQLLKKVSLAAHSKHLRTIQQVYNVHVSIRYSSDIDEQFAAIFEHTGRGASKYVAVSVRGVNNDLGALRDAMRVLLAYLTDFSHACELKYTLTIEITEYYHHLVMGNNGINVRSIMQRTGCVLTFPEIEPTARHLDLDNLNEIPVNKSTVIVRGPSFEAVHAAWNELIGFLPLVLTFDVAHDVRLDTNLLTALKKQHKVAIFLKHKEKFNTVIIRGVERHSRQLFEVRRQLLALDDSEIPVCCETHATGGFNLDLLNQFNQHHQHRNGGHLSTMLYHQLDQPGHHSNGGDGFAQHHHQQQHHHQSLDMNNLLNQVANGGSDGGVDKSIPSLLTNPELQSIFNPAMFQAVLKEQHLVMQQQQKLQQRQKHLQALGVNGAMMLNQNMNQITQQQQQQQQKPLSTMLQQQQSSMFGNQSLANQLQSRSNGFANQSTSHANFGSNGFNSLHHLPANDVGNINFGNHSLSSNSDAVLQRNRMCDEASRLLKQQLQMDKNSFMSNMSNNFGGNGTNVSSTQSTLVSSASSPALGQLATESASSSANGKSISMSCAQLNSLDNRLARMGFSTEPDSSVSSLTAMTGNNNNNNNNIFASSAGNGSIWPDRKLSYGECKYLALKKSIEEPSVSEVRVPSSIWSGFGFSKSMPPETLKSKLVEWNPLLDSPGSQTLSPPQSKLNNHHHQHNNWNPSNTGNGFNDHNAQQLSFRPRMGRPLLRQESEICSNTTPYSSNYLNQMLAGNAAAVATGGGGASALGRPLHGQNLFTPAVGSLARNEQTVCNSFGLTEDNSGSVATVDSTTTTNNIGMSSGQESNTMADERECKSVPFIDVENIDLGVVLVEFGLSKYIDIFNRSKIGFSAFLRLTDDELFRLDIPYAGRRKLVAAIAQLRSLLQSNRISTNFNLNGSTLSYPTRQTSTSTLTSSSGLGSSGLGLSGVDSHNASPVSCVDEPNVNDSSFRRLMMSKSIHDDSLTTNASATAITTTTNTTTTTTTIPATSCTTLITGNSNNSTLSSTSSSSSSSSPSSCTVDDEYEPTIFKRMRSCDDSADEGLAQSSPLINRSSVIDRLQNTTTSNFSAIGNSHTNDKMSTLDLFVGTN